MTVLVRQVPSSPVRCPLLTARCQSSPPGPLLTLTRRRVLNLAGNQIIGESSRVASHYYCNACFVLSRFFLFLLCSPLVNSASPPGLVLKTKWRCAKVNAGKEENCSLARPCRAACTVNVVYPITAACKTWGIWPLHSKPPQQHNTAGNRFRKIIVLDAGLFGTSNRCFIQQKLLLLG